MPPRRSTACSWSARQASRSSPETSSLPRSGASREVAVPTLVITGELDQPSILGGSFEIARGTGAEHVEIANAAHFPNLEHPREFNNALCDFLERSLL